MPVVEFSEKVLWLTVTAPLMVEVAMAPPSASMPDVEFPENVLWLTPSVPFSMRIAPPSALAPEVKLSVIELLLTVALPRNHMAPAKDPVPVVEFPEIVLLLTTTGPPVL